MKNVERHRSAAGHADAQTPCNRRRVRAGGRNMLEQRPVHCRHADPKSDVLLDDCLENLSRVESGQEHETESAVQPRVHLTRLRGRVKERERHQRDVLLEPSLTSGAEHVVRGHSIEQHVLVRQLSSLRVSRCARGVKDHRGIAWPSTPGLESRRLPVRQLTERQSRGNRGRRRGIDGHDHEVWTPRLVACGSRHARDGKLSGSLEGNHGSGMTVFQVVGNLARLEEHVERDHDRPGLQYPEIRDGESRYVRAGQRDMIARGDADRNETSGNPRGGRVELGVRHVPAAARDRDAIGRQARLVFQDARQVQRSRVMVNH